MISTTAIVNGIKRRLAVELRYHPSSAPYMSGDTFRNVAEHVLDKDSSLHPRAVKAGAIVFVQSARLKEFFTTIHPHIQNPYILISHNGDENITEQYLPHISDTIIHWFAQNCLVSHTKLTPLPIGLENKNYYLHGIPQHFDVLRKKTLPKEHKILYKFNANTNPKERNPALQVLATHPLAHTYADWRQSYTYLKTLQQFSFVASPPGNGEDCIRTWESLYLGTIPIVKRSYMNEYFVSLGVPMVIIDSWEELHEYTTEILTALYATMAPKLNCPALWADFWVKEIQKKYHD